jgi:preprotein translocase SecE subunit
MAEVRKKVLEDKYNTASIKTTKTEKVVKKSVKKTESKKAEKKGIIAGIKIFCNGVKSEFKKVHWTDKKSMIKYSIATILFVVFCAGFFYLIDVIFALVQSLFR